MISAGPLRTSPPDPAPPPAVAGWILAETDAAAAASLAHSAGLPLVLAQILVQRGVCTAGQAEEFFHPRIDHLLDPYTMHGMTKAVARIQLAILRREPILIYGDYDVDGTMAVVLLKTAIEMLGGEARFHVPHRIQEGYGLREEVLCTAAQQGVGLVVSVDSGIRAFAAAETAERLGLDLIITDHHLPEADPLSSGSSKLPRAFAILNPIQPGCLYACKDLCGAGIAFKLSQALLESSDPELARNKLLPSFLKLLAIATVADAVPLVGENRVFASIGLRQLRRPVHSGLRSLMQLCDLQPAERRLTTEDVAFRIAPRINAAGRMDVASEVIELFTTRDPLKARSLAEKLDRLNSERRQTEAAMLGEIERRLDEESGFQTAGCIVIDGHGWHRGILGILASRIVQRVGRPAMVIAHEDGEAHGSGRSTPGFHLLRAIESCRELFTRFGGHAQAVGFSLPSGRVAELRSRLEAWAGRQPAASQKLRCHAALPLDHVTPALFGWLQNLEPFGSGNEEPVFAAYHVRIVAPVRIMKDRHVRLQLAQGTRPGALPAVAWDGAARIQSLDLKQGSIVHLAYRIRRNEHPEFGGLELEIADLAAAV